MDSGAHFCKSNRVKSFRKFPSVADEGEYWICFPLLIGCISEFSLSLRRIFLRKIFLAISKSGDSAADPDSSESTLRGSPLPRHIVPRSLPRLPRFYRKTTSPPSQHSLSVLLAFVFLRLKHFPLASTIISLQLFSHELRALSRNFKTSLIICPAIALGRLLTASTYILPG